MKQQINSINYILHLHLSAAGLGDLALAGHRESEIGKLEQFLRKNV